MWAEVFIDGNIDAVADLLATIAQLPPGARLPRPALEGRRHAEHAVNATSVRHSAALATVLARSSGHCEIMTQQCRLTFDTLGSRIPGSDPWTLQSASEVYAACRPCTAAIAASEPGFVRRLGLVVDPPYPPMYTRFFWRQTQWVYLNEECRISPIHEAATQTAL